MGQRIPASEWPLFCAFYALEPWGYEADNYHAALVASTVANMSGNRLKSPVKISDYMTEKPLTDDQQAAYESTQERIKTYGQSGQVRSED